jgi:glucose-1-phosphate cytidylyltransferase
MKLYASHGVNDFVICCGYKGYMIKEYFSNYFLHSSDVTFDMAANTMEVHERHVEPWRVTLVDTGDSTQTGGRLRRVARYLPADRPFCFTYGDGLGDVDITALLAHHQAAGARATLTAVLPPGRFGIVDIEDGAVRRFREKPHEEGSRINGGFFVLEPSVIDYIGGDETPWEREPLERLAAEGELSAYAHNGFWQPMDTLRDRQQLEELWQQGRAPWKRWG